MGKSGTLYRPCASVTDPTVADVPVFFTVTAAPGIAAPVVSVIVPVMEAVAACPHTWLGTKVAIKQ